MKRTIVSAILVLTLASFAATRAQAYSNYHDDKHWYDSKNKRHSFVMYHHHHGYWDTDKGSKVFINID